MLGEALPYFVHAEAIASSSNRVPKEADFCALRKAPIIIIEKFRSLEKAEQVVKHICKAVVRASRKGGIIYIPIQPFRAIGLDLAECLSLRLQEHNVENAAIIMVAKNVRNLLNTIKGGLNWLGTEKQRQIIEGAPFLNNPGDNIHFLDYIGDVQELNVHGKTSIILIAGLDDFGSRNDFLSFLTQCSSCTIILVEPSLKKLHEEFPSIKDLTVEVVPDYLDFNLTEYEAHELFKSSRLLSLANIQDIHNLAKLVVYYQRTWSSRMISFLRAHIPETDTVRVLSSRSLLLFLVNSQGLQKALIELQEDKTIRVICKNLQLRERIVQEVNAV